MLDFSDLDAQEQISEMMAQTDELKAGHPPGDYVAKGVGVAGQIALHSWPYGTAKYMVLIHATQTSEVLLKVHYGP